MALAHFLSHTPKAVRQDRVNFALLHYILNMHLEQQSRTGIPNPQPQKRFCPDHKAFSYLLYS